MPAWAPYPYDSAAYRYSATNLKKHWARLHRGDAEPLPKDAKLLAAWGLLHAGEYEAAAAAGVQAGAAGSSLANKAQCLYAHYLEPHTERKQELLLQAAQRAHAQQRREPRNANAYYWEAYALGRYAQTISVVKAVEQGLGLKVKALLEQTIALAPEHADAHIALGSFHAEVIDKVGQLIGITQGADAEAGLRAFEQALKLNPDSAIARTEFANGLVMLEGEREMARAESLYHEAAACTPMDATERIEVEAAKAELED
jgi:hypothetical protein